MRHTLLVSDLDGTLLDRNQKISEENKRAIALFKKNGGYFTLATGRMEQSVIPYIDELQIDIPVILYNGAKIYCPITKTVLYERQLENYEGCARRLMSKGFSENHGILFYHAGDVYSHRRNAIVKEHERKDGVISKELTEDILSKPITKILLISESTSLLTSYEKIVREMELDCDMVYSERTYLEILPPGSSKGNALLGLVKYLNQDNLQTIAVGDNLNDLSMLEAANKGYAVENCHEYLKTTAFEKTVHHEQHAIANIIKSNFLPYYV